MNQPELNDMLNKTRNKYALVVLTARRARQITEVGTALIEDKATKPVTIALYEIAEGISREKEIISNGDGIEF